MEHTPALQPCTERKDSEGLEEVHQSCRPSPNGELGVAQSEVNYSHISAMCVRERETVDVTLLGAPLCCRPISSIIHRASVEGQVKPK